ncbi:glycoside hydrolase family 71 protein [Coprinopsis marcescibilis]|uniref:Glycoside hydrolase family 71 protein n=1 Tax=Coprinopsis marcescibilis TaxID=230819 RepID=A0A5C3KTS8_COPMA|nr:glycoside hydrolase family 71 protein [Coprinopsis marcescibilis]
MQTLWSFAQLALLLPWILTTSAQTIPKPVLMHFIVGNAYPYTASDWSRDIALASSKGIDGFVLNVGVNEWQLSRVSDAYDAASSFSSTSNAPFKMAVSFDMGSLPCAALSDGDILRTYVNTFHEHESQLMVQGDAGERPLFLTFAGQGCMFGQNSVNEGWTMVLKDESLPAIHFLPSFFLDPGLYGGMSSADGAFSWDSAWPMGNYDITNNYDTAYRTYLNGRTYMAAVSPWFFTHYGANTYNKNFIYRADNWLLAERWELLIRDREIVDMVQIISWNDYGECHYMGPIEGAQPLSEAWTAGYDHQGWLDLQHYYITAYKTGSYPTIEGDRVFLWGRLYPARTQVLTDPVGVPYNFRFTEDFVWAVVLLTTDAQVTLSCIQEGDSDSDNGEESTTQNLSAGLSKLRLKLTYDCSPVAQITRNGEDVLRFAPEGFRFSTQPTAYNFNAFVAAS